MMKTGHWLLGMTILLACRDSASDPALPGTVVLFTFGSASPADTLRVEIRDAATRGTVQAVLESRSAAHIPIGPILRGAGTDPRYPFHFDPDSVRMTEVAAEVCDALPMRTPAQVDSFIGGSTGNPSARSATWCPWAATPYRFVSP